MRNIVIIVAVVLVAAACSSQSSTPSVMNPGAPSALVTGSGTNGPMDANGHFTATPSTLYTFTNPNRSNGTTLQWTAMGGEGHDCYIESGPNASHLTKLKDVACGHGASTVGTETVTPMSTTYYQLCDTHGNQKDCYPLTVTVKTMCDVLTHTWSGTTVSTSQPSKGHNGIVTIAFESCSGEPATFHNVQATWKSSPGSTVRDDDPTITYVGTVSGGFDGTLTLEATATTPTRCGLSTQGKTTGEHLHASFLFDSPTHGRGHYTGQVCDAQDGEFTLDAPQ